MLLKVCCQKRLLNCGWRVGRFVLLLGDVAIVDAIVFAVAHAGAAVGAKSAAAVSPAVNEVVVEAGGVGSIVVGW